MMSAGQAIVKALRVEGVRYIYGVVGSAYLEILDSMYGQDDISFVGCRHEQGAGFMALGYARATGKAGVCLVQNGPGVTNLVTTTAAAMMCHSPMIILGGAPMVGQIYKDSFQELDHMSVFRPICKEVIQLNRADRVSEILSHAFRVAYSGKMGPVYVDLPRDLLNEQCLDTPVSDPMSYRPLQKPEGDVNQIQAALKEIRSAKSPVILVGGGVVWSECHQEVCRLAELIGAPIITSYERNDAVPNSHSLYIGALGRAGAPEATEACQQSDMLLALGSRLAHFTSFYNYQYVPEGTRIVQVEIDQREIGRNYPVTVGILGDVGAVAKQLIAGLNNEVLANVRDSRIERITTLREKRRQRIDSEALLNDLPMKPQRVYAELRAILEDAAVVFDAGGGPAFGYDRLNFAGPKTMFATLDLGCIGSALPQAIGVKMAKPEKKVVSINGDGGFFMNVQELETAVRWGVPVVSIVLNNGCWGSEKAYQKILYKERYVEADISNPRYDKLSELCGGRGFYVEKPEDIAPAMIEAFKEKVPSVVEIPVDPDEWPKPARVADVFEK